MQKKKPEKNNLIKNKTLRANRTSPLAQRHASYVIMTATDGRANE